MKKQYEYQTIKVKSEDKELLIQKCNDMRFYFMDLKIESECEDREEFGGVRGLDKLITGLKKVETMLEKGDKIKVSLNGMKRLRDVFFWLIELNEEMGSETIDDTELKRIFEETKRIIREG